MGIIPVTILLILLVSGITSVSAKNVSLYTDMDENERFWQPEVWGSVATNSTILHDDYISDTDIDTKLLNVDETLNGVKLQFENKEATLQNQVINLQESSFGLQSDDWLGKPNDADFPAKAGVDYWVMNGSTSTAYGKNSAVETNMTEADVFSSAVSPSQSTNQQFTSRLVFEGDADSTGEHHYSYYSLDKDVLGVDASITQDSYLYMQGYFKWYVISTDLSSDVWATKLFVIFSDAGGSKYEIGIEVSSTLVNGAEGIWRTNIPVDDIAPYTITGRALFVEEDEFDLSPTLTFGYLFNIHDILEKTAFDPNVIAVEGWYTESWSTRTVTGEYQEVVLNNLMVVDNIKDISLYEDTLTTDRTDQQTDNWLNGTSMSLSTEDIYPLSDGFKFNDQLRINRLTLTSFDYIVQPSFVPIILDGTFELKYEKEQTGYENGIKRSQEFNLKSNTEEPLTFPSTYYVNFTKIDELSYLKQLTIDGEDAFDEKGFVESAWDVKASISFTKLSDIYTKTFTGDIKVTPKVAIASDTKSLLVGVIMQYPEKVFKQIIDDEGTGFDGGVIFWSIIVALTIGMSSRAKRKRNKAKKSAKVKRANR